MTLAGTSNELNVQNEWEENTHTHTHNVLVANPKKLLYTVANPARGLLNRVKKKKKKKKKKCGVMNSILDRIIYLILASVVESLRTCSSSMVIVSKIQPSR